MNFEALFQLRSKQPFLNLFCKDFPDLTALDIRT